MQYATSGRPLLMGVGNCPLLLVEDDPELRHALAELLAYEGYTVALVADGSEALAYLRGHARPGLILLDLELPVMDGRSVIQQITADPELSKIPMVALSVDEITEPEIAALSVKALLKKPVFVETFLATVGEWYDPDHSNLAE